MDFWLLPVAQHSCKSLSQFEGVLNLQLGCLTVSSWQPLLRGLFLCQLSADYTVTLDTPHYIFITSKSFSQPTWFCFHLMRYNEWKHVHISVFCGERLWVIVCKVRAVFISIHQSICCGEWSYSCGLCNRSLSCNIFLNGLLHISQVYVYLHLTRLRRCYCR
jgi:hypothetical protein